MLRRDHLMSPRKFALSVPNGFVYEIDVDGTIVWDTQGDAPSHAIKGTWMFGPGGKIVGEFVPNPNYQPGAVLIETSP